MILDRNRRNTDDLECGKKVFTQPTADDQDQCKRKNSILLLMGVGLLCLLFAVGSNHGGHWLVGIVLFLVSLFLFLMAYRTSVRRGALQVEKVLCDEEGMWLVYERPGPVCFVEWKQVSEIELTSYDEGIFRNTKPYGWDRISILGNFLLEDGTSHYGTRSLPHSKYMTSDGLYLVAFWEEYEGVKDKLRKIYN